ncbi:MAG: PilZ domain-containing protein [Deltaproteobacteria bacterium]|nr:PilZ domain-containing protein [Deltaproteobacteria bacterium]
MTLFVKKVHARGEPELCRARDLSESGMYLVKLPRPQIAESRYTWLEFQLPGDERPVRALAELVRAREEPDLAGRALRFKYISPKDKVRVARFLEAA